MNDLSLFNSLFDGFGGACAFPPFGFKKAFSPNVDVKEEEANYTLQMDLPGKTDKDVKIELDRNVLTISSESETASEQSADGEKGGAEEKDAGKERWLIRERTRARFSRSFTVPDDVDSDSLSANVKNGVLTVIMPRHAQPSPRRIAVNCG